MTDLARYTRARTERDSEFAEDLESGYEDFRDDVLLRQARDAVRLTEEEGGECRQA